MSYSCIFNKKGNIKVGEMWTFNKLAGSGVLGGCKGTCGEFCKGCYNAENPAKSNCYVFKSYRTYGWDTSTVVRGHVRNTNAVRQDEIVAFQDLGLQIQRAKKKPSVIRIHASGEIETATELSAWVALSTRFPNISFYMYTKNFVAVRALFRSINALPKNFFINLSVWHESGVQIYNEFKDKRGVRAFVYCDDYDYSGKIKIDCMCPAYSKTGKLKHDRTCAECGICFQNKAKVCGCYSH